MLRPAPNLLYFMLAALPLTAQTRAIRTESITPITRQNFERQVKVALVVGISAYPEAGGLSSLKYAVRDADVLGDILKAQGYLVSRLKDSEATRSVIRRTLRQLADAVSPDEGTFLFYFTGHGYTFKGKNYLATFGVSADDLDGEGLGVNEVEDLLRASKAKRKLMFIDACRNDPTSGAKSAGPRSFEKLAASEGMRELYSTKEGRVSYEDDDLRQGIFTYFLAKGMAGEAAGADGYVTFRDLAEYVTDKVRAYTVEKRLVQIPFEAGESSGDFLLGVKSVGAAPAPPDALATAKALYNAKKYEEALPLFRKAADAGNPEAAGFLGRMFEAGRGGLPKDATQAAKWYRISANAGDAQGSTGLGLMYAFGQGGLPLDYPQAATWLRKGADAGDSAGMCTLGALYLFGNGVRKDDSQAVAWIRKAVDRGNAHCMAVLGNLYEMGNGGLAKDALLALGLYRRAAEAEDTMGMANLGFLYEVGGAGLASDDVQAAYWYRKAAEGENPGAMVRLGRLYQYGRGGLPKDEAQALAWYRRAVELEDVSGMFNLAAMYEMGLGGLTKDKAQAVYWYRKAADGGVLDAMVDLGRLHQFGEGGLPQDNAKAVALYKKAADGGNAFGMADLGYMYEFGLGLPRDKDQAVYWYRKAVDLGDIDAMVKLGQFYMTGGGPVNLNQPEKINESTDIQAVTWLRKAAEQGSPAGMYNLAFMYEQGRGGLQKDITQAIDWYRRAAALNYPLAEYAVNRLSR